MRLVIYDATAGKENRIDVACNAYAFAQAWRYVKKSELNAIDSVP